MSGDREGLAKSFVLDQPWVRVQEKPDDWSKFFSDTRKYKDEDLFLHYLVYNYKWGNKNAPEFLIIIALWVSIAIFSWIIVMLIDEKISELPFFSPAIESTLSFLRDCKILGRIEPFFETSLSPLLTILALMIAGFSLGRLAHVEGKVSLFRELLSYNNVQNSQKVQLIPSVGNAKFSFGEKGFYCDAGSIQYLVEWRAIEKVEPWSAGSAMDRRERSKYAQNSDWDKSPTHIVLVMKKEHEPEAVALKRTERYQQEAPSLRPIEHIVIPRRFFDSDRNATKWDTFVSEIRKEVDKNRN